MPNFLMICGPQAVGKMTVGQELEKITGYKLLYNHMTIEITRKIFDYDRDAFRHINVVIRDCIFKEFSKSNEKGLIFTSCFDFKNELEYDTKLYNEWTKLFDETYVVELEADLEERLRRNKTENRLKHKESKRNLEWSEKDLLESPKKHQLNSNPGQAEKLFKNYMKINNTSIPAEEVAKMIKEKFEI